MFVCDRCGECCRHLNLSPLYQGLDRGDGTCRFLEGNLCGVYESRPLLCRVDESFDLLFRSTMSRDEYYKRNLEACRKMKNHIF